MGTVSNLNANRSQQERDAIAAAEQKQIDRLANSKRLLGLLIDLERAYPPSPAVADRVTPSRAARPLISTGHRGLRGNVIPFPGREH
jgi:hypothetical protein